MSPPSPSLSIAVLPTRGRFLRGNGECSLTTQLLRPMGRRLWGFLVIPATILSFLGGGLRRFLRSCLNLRTTLGFGDGGWARYGGVFVKVETTNNKVDGGDVNASLGKWNRITHWWVLIVDVGWWGWTRTSDRTLDWLGRDQVEVGLVTQQEGARSSLRQSRSEANTRRFAPRIRLAPTLPPLVSRTLMVKRILWLECEYDRSRSGSTAQHYWLEWDQVSVDDSVSCLVLWFRLLSSGEGWAHNLLKNNYATVRCGLMTKWRDLTYFNSGAKMYWDECIRI